MMRFRLLSISAIALLAFCTGCSSKYTVLCEGQKVDSGLTRQQLDILYDYQIKEDLLRTRAELRMKNGSNFEGANFSIRDDSLAWISVDDKMPHRVAISDVQSIIKKNRLLGGIEGFSIGTLGGLMMGTLAYELDRGPDGSIGQRGPDLFGLILFAGTLGGTTVGIVLGDRDEYRFNYYLTSERRKKE